MVDRVTPRSTELVALLAAVARRVAARPALWPTALRQLRALAAPRWWRRRPWLPLPAPDYLHFRLQTMYGAAGPGTDRASRARAAAEISRWLAWAGEEHRAARAQGSSV